MDSGDDVSQLRCSGSDQDDFFHNCLSIQSPIFGQMNSAQTKSKIQYFPIKAHQPEIQFNVIFTSQDLWEDWQVWVRTNMTKAQGANGQSGNIGVTLNWPERSINNWSGIILKQKAGGMRYNYAPRDSFTVELVNSLVSNSTTIASFGTAWQSIIEAGFSTDTLLALPDALNAGLNSGQVSSTGGTVAGNTAALSNVSNSIAGLIPGLGGFG